MKKPNFFIVGEARCGTTALYKMLMQHPDIFMPVEKEPRYFAKDLIEEGKEFHKIVGGNTFFKNYFPIQTEKQYLKIFKNANKRIIGDASVCYAVSKVAAQEIFRFNPDARIIMLFREPVDFLYSLYKHKYAVQEPKKSFIQALKAEDERRKDNKKISIKAPYPSVIYYSENIKFYEHIQRFLKVFPKKQIKVIIYNDFKNDNAKVFREISEFLEINIDFKPKFKKYNLGRKTKFIFLKSFIKHPYVWMVPKKILPESWFISIKEFMLGLSTTNNKETAIKPELKNMLMERFKQEVIMLNNILHNNDLIGKEKNLLELWGYDKI